MKKPFKNPFRHHRAKNRNKPRGYSPTQIICVSFVIVIALGTLLLSLPIASRYGRMRVIDAMFTATSATCVTGLVVRDTWTQFTAFGQAVILVLIQVGGLGLVTLTSFFARPCGGAWASGTCECWARACRLMAMRRPKMC